MKFLLEQRIAILAQQKWLAKLLGYALVVEYKKGVENKVADALSRRFDYIPELCQQNESSKAGCLLLLLVPDRTWLKILRDSYSQDQSM